MKSIAVFNNKGGVGKSTLTLLIADFFSSTSVRINGRAPRVTRPDFCAGAVFGCDPPICVRAADKISLVFLNRGLN